MNNPDLKLLKPVLFFSFILLLIAFLNYAQTFLIPLCIAGLLSFLLFPVSERLKKWGLHPVISILLSILLSLAVIVGLGFFFTSQILSFRDDLPLLQQQLSDKLGNIQNFIEAKTQITQEEQLAIARQKVNESLEKGGYYLMSFFSATGTFLAMAALVPIYIFFFTFYKDKIESFILQISKKENHSLIKTILERISKITQKYLSGILIDIAILSVLNSTGFLLLGLSHAILLGITASILNIIPYVGVLIGSLFPIIMALLTKDSLWFAFGALGVCVVVQFLDNNFITPKVVGSSVSLNPLATLMILIIGGLLWGVAGMMLFIPLLGMTKVILDNIPSLSAYGYLIGEERIMNKKKSPPIVEDF